MIEHESHIRIFTESSLVYLMRKHGFKDIKVITAPYVNQGKLGVNNDIVGLFKKSN